MGGDTKLLASWEGGRRFLKTRGMGRAVHRWFVRKNTRSSHGCNEIDLQKQGSRQAALLVFFIKNPTPPPQTLVPGKLAGLAKGILAAKPSPTLHPQHRIGTQWGCVGWEVTFPITMGRGLKVAKLSPTPHTTIQRMCHKSLLYSAQLQSGTREISNCSKNSFSAVSSTNSKQLSPRKPAGTGLGWGGSQQSPIHSPPPQLFPTDTPGRVTGLEGMPAAYHLQDLSCHELVLLE